jgi:hypothetical protein
MLKYFKLFAAGNVTVGVSFSTNLIARFGPSIRPLFKLSPYVILGYGEQRDQRLDAVDAARDYANEEITAPQITTFLTGYVKATREGLSGFIRNPPKNYPLTPEPITRAVSMANTLRNVTGRETAFALTILVLYDLVMLIGMYCSVSHFQQRCSRLSASHPAVRH